MTNNSLMKKIRRRIRRRISTGQNVHRVRVLEDGKFGYVEKHGSKMLVFTVSKKGRLMRQSDH